MNAPKNGCSKTKSKDDARYAIPEDSGNNSVLTGEGGDQLMFMKVFTVKELEVF